MNTEPKIDFVVPWVDGGDPEWQKEKMKYLNADAPSDQIDVRAVRYRDWDHMRYWFRAVEKYAPWVNRIHFVTCGHLPSWLNTNAPKLNIVRHHDYIPEEYLPTFSSHPIELNMHRIEGLSEQFVYFNDDLFLTAPVKPSDFFVKGLPCDCIKEDPIPFHTAELYNQIIINDLLFASRNFDRRKTRKNIATKWFSVRAPKAAFRNILTSFMGHRDYFGLSTHHLPQAYLKESLVELWAMEPDLLHETSGHRFRDANDISQNSIKFLQLLSGSFQPYDKERFGKALNVGTDLELICDCIVGQSYKCICINDNESVDFAQAKLRLDAAFETALPQKSEYEL